MKKTVKPVKAKKPTKSTPAQKLMNDIKKMKGEC